MAHTDAVLELAVKARGKEDLHRPCFAHLLLEQTLKS